jgi:hypothetical protein
MISWEAADGALFMACRNGGGKPAPRKGRARRGQGMLRGHVIFVLT